MSVQSNAAALRSVAPPQVIRAPHDPWPSGTSEQKPNPSQTCGYKQMLRVSWWSYCSAGAADVSACHLSSSLFKLVPVCWKRDQLSVLEQPVSRLKPSATFKSFLFLHSKHSILNQLPVHGLEPKCTVQCEISGLINTRYWDDHFLFLLYMFLFLCWSCPAVWY